MTENKWTPGPWTATDREGAGTYAHVSSFEDGFGNICTVWSENAHANARLIAAAPEMAEALQRLYATWMAARAEVEGANTSHDLFVKEPEVIAVRAALAKARGES